MQFRSLPLANAPAVRSAGNSQSPAPIALWLLACCVLLFLMVVVGGAPRLTHSGLSIVAWQPILGTVPPLNDTQWQCTFPMCQLTADYQPVNRRRPLRD